MAGTGEGDGESEGFLKGMVCSMNMRFDLACGKMYAGIVLHTKYAHVKVPSIIYFESARIYNASVVFILTSISQ